jgi:hypothetical protein
MHPHLSLPVPLVFEQTHVTDTVAAVKNSRLALEAAAMEDRVRSPPLVNLRWRVDVAISTSALSRCLKPGLTFQMTLGDGRIKTFEVPLEQFHTLRHGVASALRALSTLERHPIMKIMDALEEQDAALRQK